MGVREYIPVFVCASCGHKFKNELVCGSCGHDVFEDLQVVTHTDPEVQRPATPAETEWLKDSGHETVTSKSPKKRGG